MSTYMVAKSEEQFGPFDVPTIKEKLRSGQLDWTDYLYLESSSEWVLMMDVPFLADLLEEIKSKAPKKNPKDSLPEHNEAQSKFGLIWYVLKSDNKFGPFSYFDVIKMVQEKALFEDDFIWKQGMNHWQRLAEVSDFYADQIRSVLEKSDSQDVFNRRRHNRAKYGAPLILHDNKSVWSGQSMEVSVGGAGIIVNNPNLSTGTTLYLHFKPGPGVPSFNAVGTIVSKQCGVGADVTAPVRYGVRFVSISNSVVRSIQDYTTKGAS